MNTTELLFLCLSLIGAFAAGWTMRGEIEARKNKSIDASIDALLRRSDK